jgi:hypothetical protein
MFGALFRVSLASVGLPTNISGQAFSNEAAVHVTRLFNCLRMIGIIKKVGKRYKYYLTGLGRQWAVMALKVDAKL